MFYFRLRKSDCLQFVLKPCQKLFQFDGVRPETHNFDSAVALDEKMRNLMKSLQIPFVYVTIEDLQERAEFVADQLFKRWPNFKRGQMNAIPVAKNSGDNTTES